MSFRPGEKPKKYHANGPIAQNHASKHLAGKAGLSSGCPGFVIKKPAKKDLACKCVHSRVQNRQVVCKPAQKPTGTTLTIGPGCEVHLPLDFFDDYKHKGAVFKMKTSCQNGHKIALKWVKPSHACHFSKHVMYLTTAAEITASILSSFRKSVDMRGWNIQIVKPVLLRNANETVIEPYVSNVQKFTSNALWEFDVSTTYHKLIIALAHFSYVVSDGKYVLADLQGGVDESKCIVTLLPPTVVSAQEGKHGCRDIGTAHRFFNFHSCNWFCKNMPKPHERKSKPAQPGCACCGKSDKGIKFVTM